MDSQISLGRFRVRKINGEIIEATKIKTRGDDDNWPTFLLDDGGLLGVSAEAVLGPAGDDSCPVDGIERFEFVEPPSPELVESIIRMDDTYGNNDESWTRNAGEDVP